MNEKLQEAIDLLTEYSSDLENLLYDKYYPGALKQKLEEIATAQQNLEDFKEL